MSWRARLSPALLSMTVWLNPKDPNCFGVRNWLRRNVPELQLLNPDFSISVQEVSFGEPFMFIYYTAVDDRTVRLAGATEDEFEDIVEACVTYGMNHAVHERHEADDGGDPQMMAMITSFGYTESFNAKLEVSPAGDMGQATTQGVDDPGQRPRLQPRNLGSKMLP